MRLQSAIARNRFVDSLFAILGLLAMLVGLVTLLALFLGLALDGWSRLTWRFFTSYPSRFPVEAGILSAWVGTTTGMFVTALTAVAIGVVAAGYREEDPAKHLLS